MRISSNISFGFWAMEIQEKMLLRFTDFQQKLHYSWYVKIGQKLMSLCTQENN